MSQNNELRKEFWKKTLDELRARGVSRFDNISPSIESFLGCSTGISGCTYYLYILTGGVRVELDIERFHKRENKMIFDRLESEKPEIERRFGQGLEWRRQDDTKVSRICYSHSFDGYSRENWPEMIDWLCQNIVKLDEAFFEPLARISQEL